MSYAFNNKVGSWFSGGGLGKFGCGERSVRKMERRLVKVRFSHAEFVDELKGRYN